MTTMTRAQEARQLNEGLNAVFGTKYRRYEDEWKGLFNVSSSKKAYEEDVLFAGTGAAPVKPEGAPLSYDSMKEGWSQRYQHETIALGLAFTEEAFDDNLYMDLGKKGSTALAQSLKHTKAIKAASIFNNGTSSSYNGGDGVPLFSTAHPLLGGGTFSNRLTTAADLSETALEDSLIAISGFVDERGIPTMVEARTLVIPRQSEFIAERILGNSNRPGTADRDINAIVKRGKFPGGVKVLRRLTSTTAFFIVTDAEDGLRHFTRKSVSTKMDGDFDTGNVRYRVSERYSFGWTDPRGAFGNGG